MSREAIGFLQKSVSIAGFWNPLAVRGAATTTRLQRSGAELPPLQSPEPLSYYLAQNA